MSLLGALSCSRLRVPLPGLAELRAAGLGTVLCMGMCNAATCFLFMPLPVLTHVRRAVTCSRAVDLRCRARQLAPEGPHTRCVYASSVLYVPHAVAVREIDSLCHVWHRRLSLSLLPLSLCLP